MRASAIAVLIGAAAFGQTLVIRDVRVFDGERTIGRTTVVVAGGKITAMGTAAAVPAGARVIDGSGKTLLPGLIDAHTHTVNPELLKQAAVLGVTTTLDMFTSPQLVKMVKASPAPGAADLKSAGYLATVPKGHGTEYGMPVPTLTKPEEAQAWVDARIAEGSDYIKIIYDGGKAYNTALPTLSEATVKALVTAAHARGKMAVVHVGTLDEAESALRAGADGLVHLFTGPVSEPGFGKLAAEHKAFVVPTVSVLCGGANGFNARLADDADLKPYLIEAERVTLKRTFGFKMSCDGTIEAVKQLRAARVPILTGSDALNPGTTQGATVHGEMELLVSAGLTPSEALQAATSAAAKAFKLDDRGVIAVGKRADLVLVNGDPTREITATRKIENVWVNGVEVDRASWRSMVEKAAAEEAKKKERPGPAGLDLGLVSDFEGETVRANFGSGWLISLDSMMGGKSTAKMELAPGGAQGSKGALKVTGEVKEGFAYPWAGVMYSPGPTPMAPANLSSKKAVTFWAKGDGKEVRIMMFAQKLGMQPAIQTFDAGAEWKSYKFTFADFGVDGSDVMAVMWVGGPGAGKFEFWVDNVRFE